MVRDSVPEREHGDLTRTQHYIEDPDQLLFPEMAESVVTNDVTGEPRHSLARSRLIAALGASDFGRIEPRVALILQHYPETRDDDVSLLLRYYEVHQADILERWDRQTLDILYSLDSVLSIIRARQKIQNDYGMFVGTLSTRHRREGLAAQFYRYMLRKSDQDAEIRIYLDETRGEPNSRYVGVAGVCIIDWRQYGPSYMALRKWRADTGWTETLHASTQASHSVDRHLALLAELRRRRAGLVFVGHDVAARSTSSHIMVDLFVQMVMGCLETMSRENCLGRERAVVLIKEAEDGFDRAYGGMLEESLRQQIAYEYPHIAYLKRVDTLRKGQDVFLEIADMIAFGMQRRAMYKGWSNADKLADAVANVTGFENSDQIGVVYKSWY